MEIALKPWSETLLRWLVGGIFVIAGALKVPDPGAFLQAIDGYRLLPFWPAAVFAVCLPWLEIACGAALIVKRFYSGALVLLGGLTGLFIMALLSALVRGLDIECGCFGSGDPLGRVGLALARDVALLAALGWLWYRGSGRAGRATP